MSEDDMHIARHTNWGHDSITPEDGMRIVVVTVLGLLHKLQLGEGERVSDLRVVG